MDKRNKWHRLIIRNMPVLRDVPPSLRLKAWLRLAINTEYEFAYIRIPKAANSTVVRTLALQAYPEQQAKIEADPRGREAKNLFHTLSPRQCLTQRCLKRRYYTFSFFRNPYTRVLSAYLDKLRSECSRQKKGWKRKIGNWALDADTSFEDFVTSLERGNLYANIHWAPQTAICPLPVQELDFVGRIENLEADLAVVTARLFGKPEDSVSGQSEHNRQNADGRLATFYTFELQERVYQLFQDDFEQIGYDRHLTVRPSAPA